ncbi:thiamine-phosphate kinase [Catenovulum sediminis]|uniref:Thiamine-monophosphate kinase n=1 Tax=Catenovulum sediminis TaxID=1740262 RepID=A0ABV1RGN1_9ALTE|nr:thiamine-phosphate kinase [Catenovulum sediminis]
MAEFDIISRFFTFGEKPDSVVLDKGDDCALVRSGNATELLAITTDTLVCGTHFLQDIPPHALAYRCLATNLSDLAAMGAMPRWFSLALSLPKEIAQNQDWLAEFSQGLQVLSAEHNIYLIGGDTTSGPLSVTISAVGQVAENRCLLRKNAKVGDLICVSGTLGDAAGALKIMLDQSTPCDIETRDALFSRFNYPSARVQVGLALLAFSSCAIDISDGLLADLTHILKASNCCATIDIDKLPLSPALVRQFGQQAAQRMSLSGGDDYELCFTIKPSDIDKLRATAEKLDIPLHVIGQIVEGEGEGLKVVQQGQIIEISDMGYQHFA